MVADLSEFQARVLMALVEGYRAREGMKDRIRALNEWEVARRSGYTDISYAEYSEHPARNVMLQAISTLQQRGLIQVWERGVKYDTFIPTPSATISAELTPTDESPPEGTASDQIATSNEAIIARLDEIANLLRSIERKLGGT
ncbi:MAG: hypothetical protein HW416_978 [Chloroflexi bacterium]|nr:hypothetical protein [Chloroflexota bacterium]